MLVGQIFEVLTTKWTDYIKIFNKYKWSTDQSTVLELSRSASVQIRIKYKIIQVRPGQRLNKPLTRSLTLLILYQYLAQILDKNLTKYITFVCLFVYTLSGDYCLNLVNRLQLYNIICDNNQSVCMNFN